MELFKERLVQTLTTRQSDHKHVLLIMSENKLPIGARRRLFRFEAVDFEGGGGGGEGGDCGNYLGKKIMLLKV